MTILKALAKYIFIYIAFFIFITMFVGSSLQQANYIIVSIALLLTFASSFIDFFLTGNTLATSKTGSYFKKILWKIALAVTGVSVIWSQFLSTLFGI